MCEENKTLSTRICKTCNDEKTIDLFRGKQCKQCLYKHQTERNKEYMKKYYQEKREELLKHQNDLYNHVYKVEKLKQNHGIKLKAGRPSKYILN
jgi:hypothetical protein